jgi:hypothetical protein
MDYPLVAHQDNPVAGSTPHLSAWLLRPSADRGAEYGAPTAASGSVLAFSPQRSVPGLVGHAVGQDVPPPEWGTVYGPSPAIGVQRP